MIASEARRRRLKAGAIHLGLSATLAAAIAPIALALWYPGDYRLVAGGLKLFWLIVSVDVVMGPLLTLVVFNIAKPRSELIRDLAVIAALQLSALAYGLYTLHHARPVALVFEVDRFRVVPANGVRLQELPQAQEAYRRLPITGPWVLGARASRTGDEVLEAVDLATQGYDIGQRPSYWQPYEASRADVMKRSRSIDALLARYPQSRADLESRLERLALQANTGRFLPLQGHVDGWVALLRPNGDIAGFAPYDGFF